MNARNIWFALTAALILIALIAAGIWTYYVYYHRTDGSTPILEAQVLQELAQDWSEIEQGPLKHGGESGHWFLNEVQFTGPATLLVWYEDGLNDEFSLLSYANGEFRLVKTFRSRSELPSGQNIYRYNSDLRTFERLTSGSVFSASGMVSTVKIALLNPSGDMPNEVKSGDISGCDHVIFLEREVAPTQAPLTAALNVLLADPGGWSADEKIYNYIGQGALKLDSVSVANGTAKIYLSGTQPTLGGVCDDPRMFVQVAQTARQFATVQNVELYVNGQRNTGSSNLRGE